MALAIPKNSIVLVTGCNGYIASHVADQLLEAGYRVRGTVRNITKIQGLAALWEKKFGAGRFEVANVTDVSQEGAFDEAMQGVSGVAHVASVMTLDPNPNKVIPEVLAGMNGILRSAAKESSVKRFVATSSYAAATLPSPGKVFHIDSNTWNEAAIKEAWAPPPYQRERRIAVYAASKVESERCVWKFVKDQNPHFVVNTVLPDHNIGLILDKNLHLIASSAGSVTELFNGKEQRHPPQYFVDVQDTARLHVAALINPDVKNERLFAMAAPFNWNDVLRIFRELRPDRKFIADYLDDEEDRDLSTVSNERSVELLKTLGRPGWTSLKDSVKNNIEGL